MTARPAQPPLFAAPTFTGGVEQGRTKAGIACCRDCGESQPLPSLQPGMIAQCRRCGATLRRPWGDPLRLGIALGFAALMLLATGALGDLAVVSVAGQRRTANLFAGPMALADSGLWELSIPVVFCSIVAPAAVVCLLLYVLTGLRGKTPPPGLRLAYRLYLGLRPWAMIEVFIVGYFVAYAKLGALVRITPDTGIFALFGFMVTIVAVDALIDPQSVWDAIDRAGAPDVAHAAQRATRTGADVLACESCGLACVPARHDERCPRCAAVLHRRRPDSLARTAALAMTGLVLYLPANVYPALTVVRLGHGSPSTILGGVWELLAAGELPLAALVFCASVAVPIFKLIALAVMMTAAVRGGTRRARDLTKLYRVVMVIGRWSMIDIFMESILGSLVQFGELATIKPGEGAIAFAAVVVVTMLAADSFDPRLMWDRVRR